MHDLEQAIVAQPQPEKMWHRPLEMDELGSTPPAGYPMSLIESTANAQPQIPDGQNGQPQS